MVNCAGLQADAVRELTKVPAIRIVPTARDVLIREDPDYGAIVCRCRDVTKGEVLEALRRGASAVEGIKRRTGAGPTLETASSSWAAATWGRS